MSDSIQTEWRSLGAVWQSQQPSMQTSRSDLGALAARQDRASRRMRVFVVVAWFLAFATAAWLIASTPFKPLAILLTALLGAVLVAAKRLTRADGEAGQHALITSVQDAVTRQEDVVRTAWAGAAVSMAALATVLFAVSRLLLIAGSHTTSQSGWIALAIAGLYAIAGAGYCSVRGLLARAELRRLIKLYAELRQSPE